jgi:hypothetical protein
MGNACRREQRIDSSQKVFQKVAGIGDCPYNTSMTTEEEKLVTLYKDEAFRGQTIRQEIPVCDCGKIYEEKDICNAPGVFFRDVDVFGRTFTLIEPLCPICKRRIQASYHILN